jgi:8-oxo-dGTP pyrophosphatase MutT (NUDIX family)
VLLLHRVKTSKSFAAAHVFPGGNLDAFHDGELPNLSTPEVHQDSAAYRLGAIRECFEETGILLARPKGSSSPDTTSATSLIDVSEAERETARRRVHDNEVRFGDWVDSVGGTPDVQGLMPFTRWITPANVGRRFTTQMYLYMIPDGGSGAGGEAREMTIPTPDGGVEHTAALFDDASAWLARAASGDDILFPPQVFLLHLVNRFCSGSSTPPPAGPPTAVREHYQVQRQALADFLRATPTSTAAHPSSAIPWAEKVMSPHSLFVRGSDDRIVLGIERPGPELRGSARGGDYERVVLARFTGEGPRRVEVRSRDEVFREHRAEEQEAEAARKDEPKL